MGIENSLLQELSQAIPSLNLQIYFKASLTALSHAMEDLVLAGDDQPLVIANFQQERFYRQETQRYRRIAQRTDQVYVLAAPETDFATAPAPYQTIALDATDELAQEWHLVIIGAHYSACLVCREYAAPMGAIALDTARQFRGFWSFDPEVSRQAAIALLRQIEHYRPDLAIAIATTQTRYQLTQPRDIAVTNVSVMPSLPVELDVRLFSDRLVTYLQANQYKQVKAYANLQQLNQQLTAIKQIQNNLIAIVGHELRTPLSTIQVCLESLELEPDMPDEMRQSMVEIALADAARLRHLIQDFLLLSRLENELSTLQIEAVNVVDAIELAMSQVKGTWSAANSSTVNFPTMTISSLDDLPLAIVDSDALAQLLNRLLDNACKFTPATGAITISLNLDRTQSKPMIVVQIADTGCGIAAAQLETIFQQFHQEEGFLRRSVGGTGLGLAICRRLVQQMGGQIWATSAGKGQGSEFYVALPAAIGII
jgi:DICT domain-containing protein/two-component sensor histidine kinase